VLFCGCAVRYFVFLFLFLSSKLSDVSLGLLITDSNMARKGLRAASISHVKKADAEDALCEPLKPFLAYCMFTPTVFLSYFANYILIFVAIDKIL
jgi:hypothetical protein